LFARKLRAYLKGYSIYDRLLTIATLFKLGWKGLPGANILVIIILD
jgi:hypothetical protein